MSASITTTPAGTARNRIRGPVVTLSAVAAATLALHVRDPHVSHSWGVCPLYALTGVYCPACGCLRAVNDLTNGHLAAAVSSNLLFVCVLPVVAVLFARWGADSWRGLPTAPPRVGRGLGIALIVLVVAFTVARNLPGSWLAP